MHTMSNVLEQAISSDDAGQAAKIIRDALGIGSGDVAYYCFPKTWPAGREQRAHIIGDWLQKEAQFIARVTEPHRFPRPWTIDDAHSCFTVQDADRQMLAYVYFEAEPDRRVASKLPTHDEARQIATNIAKLPYLLQGGAKA